MQHNSDYDARAAAEAGLEARKPQRVRKQDERTVAGARPRRCQARIEVPDRTGEGVVVFTCNSGVHVEAHQTLIEHIERGRIQLKDGRVVGYAFTWSDVAQREVWRGARSNS